MVPEASPKTMQSLGSLLLQASVLSVPAALLASVPSAFRASGSGVSMLDAWMAVAAILAIPLLATLVLLRVGRGILLRIDRERTALLLSGVLLWAVLCLLVNSVAGAVLKSVTHHRGLAGVTFAVMAFVAAAVAALLSWRVVTYGRAKIVAFAQLRLAAEAPWAGVVLPLVFAWLVPLGGACLRVGTVTAPKGGLAGILLDALFAFGALLGAVWAERNPVSLFESRALRTAGAVVLSLMLGFGTYRVRSSPPLLRAIGLAAPLAYEIQVHMSLGDAPQPTL